MINFVFYSELLYLRMSLVLIISEIIHLLTVNVLSHVYCNVFIDIIIIIIDFVKIVFIFLIKKAVLIPSCVITIVHCMVFELIPVLRL